VSDEKRTPETTSAIDKLMHEADEIIRMAEELSNRGYGAEAAFFAVIAAGRLQAIRALERLRDVGRPPCPREQGLCIWPMCDHPARCLLPNARSTTEKMYEGINDGR
jgi:hypothetical protein